jgi:lipoprotein-anchoring transpeptidase ErfK/SrfK
MVDYVSLLARTVGSLNPNTLERRYALYDRARKALAERLSVSGPVLSNADLKAEMGSLEAAIRRVEADALRRAAPSQPKSAINTYDTPIEAYQDRPPLQDTRKRLRIIVGAVSALVIILAGAGIYSIWPHIIFDLRNSKARSVNRSAEQPAADKSYIYMRQLVYYRTNYPEGTIIVDKPQAFIYVVRPRLAALRYSVGVGPKCMTLAGLYHVMQKEEWPGWKALPQPTADTIDERMKNPLGARALNLTNDYRIHGTNASPTNGRQGSERCIGLVNDDVINLYDHTPLGASVVVLN